MDQLTGAPGEGDIGIEVFLTPTPGIGGRARKSPEDFVVEEVSRYPERQDDGRFVIATVTSTNWETNRLVRQLSKALRISRNKIGFAGTKDKRAVTTQLMSFEAPLEEVTGLRLHQIVISDAYRARKPMTIGDLVGNSFRVTVRDCNLRDEELEKAARGTASALEELGGFPNFFGVQRFGALRPVTHVVGRHIVRGEFERAVMAYVANPMQGEGEDSREARRMLDETRDFAAALASYPKKLTFERTVIAHLAKNPDDYSGAIGALPPNLQMMFTHAYQSHLFNKVLSQRIRAGLPLDRPVVGDVVLPTDRSGLIDREARILVTEENLDLVERRMAERKAFVSGILFGSESEFAEGEMGRMERQTIEAEGIRREDFIVPELPQCSSKGSRRELLARLDKLEMTVRGQDLALSFSLDRGCYATALLREFMKAGVSDY